jgi:hypothetical protein
VDAEVSKRLANGQFEEVHERTFPLALCPLDVVPKSSGGFRLILDARWPNAFLPSIPFRMEDLRKVAEVVDPGDALFSTDLQDAYLAFRIEPESRRYLCFDWRGKTYTNNVLPFGLGLSPWVFTKALLVVITLLRILGISVVGYVDDFLFAGKPEKIHELVTGGGCVIFSVSSCLRRVTGRRRRIRVFRAAPQHRIVRVQGTCAQAGQARKMVHRLIRRAEAGWASTPRDLGVVAESFSWQ